MVDINKILSDQAKADIVKFNPGDHVSVQVRVVEGDKERYPWRRVKQNLHCKKNFKRRRS